MNSVCRGDCAYNQASGRKGMAPPTANAASFAHSFSRHVQAIPDEERTYAGHIEGAPHSEVLRDFGLGAQVLFDLGCRKIHLMSNSDRRIVGLEGFGIEVVERVPLPLAGAARVVSLPARGDKT